ncbi:MAG: hypothetical protein J3R72DRAFT_425340 [Linnemannia gamsii]|nr:MAG: hypothetical protein J3R72DRAFT_425340 [Linnemannia gamsii]
MSYSMSDGYESRQQSDDDTNESSRNGWDEDCDESTFDRTNEEFDFEENNASDIESHKDLPRGYDNEYGDRFLTADDSPLRASRNAMLLKSPSTRSTQRHLAIQQHYDQQRQTSDDDDDGDELPSLQQVAMANAQKNRLSLVPSRRLQERQEMRDSNGGSIATTADNDHTSSTGEPVIRNVSQTSSYVGGANRATNVRESSSPSIHPARSNVLGTPHRDRQQQQHSDVQSASSKSSLPMYNPFMQQAEHGTPEHPNYTLGMDVTDPSNSNGNDSDYIQKRRYGGQLTSFQPPVYGRSTSSPQLGAYSSSSQSPYQPTNLPAASMWPDFTQFRGPTAPSLSSNTLSESTSSHDQAQSPSHSRSHLSSMALPLTPQTLRILASEPAFTPSKKRKGKNKVEESARILRLQSLFGGSLAWCQFYADIPLGLIPSREAMVAVPPPEWLKPLLKVPFEKATRNDSELGHFYKNIPGTGFSCQVAIEPDLTDSTDPNVPNNTNAHLDRGGHHQPLDVCNQRTIPRTG